LGVAAVLGRATFRTLANAIAIPRLLLPAWLLLLPTLIILLTNFDVGVERVAPAAILPIVEPAIWSGILLTVVLAAVSILASFPIGVLLALGRRSRLPVVKGFSVLLIELVRGVPLITILFMAQVMLPLFLPTELTLDRVLRAMAGMTLFTAAYLAEIVRGGLQAIPGPADGNPPDHGSIRQHLQGHDPGHHRGPARPLGGGPERDQTA